MGGGAPRRRLTSGSRQPADCEGHHVCAKRPGEALMCHPIVPNALGSITECLCACASTPARALNDSFSCATAPRRITECPFSCAIAPPRALDDSFSCASGSQRIIECLARPANTARQALDDCAGAGDSLGRACEWPPRARRTTRSGALETHRPPAAWGFTPSGARGASASRAYSPRGRDPKPPGARHVRVAGLVRKVSPQGLSASSGSETGSSARGRRPCRRLCASGGAISSASPSYQRM